MSKVNVTELRQKLPAYLDKVQKGKEFDVTSRGKVIARIVPMADMHEQACQRLLAASKLCRIGDVVSPTGAIWNAERDRS